MAFPVDQINNKEAFDNLIREGLTFTADGLLDVKSRTWLYRALKDKLNIKTGSNPGTNTLLDGGTTMYRVIDKKSYASFREIKVNALTDNDFDKGDEKFQLEVPIKQGITKAQRTSYDEFLYDEQTGKQLNMTPDLVVERVGSFRKKMDEVIGKWADIKLFDLLFNSTYKTKIENNTTTAGDDTITLSYDELTNKISNVSSYKFVYEIEKILALSETINIADRKGILGIIPIHEKILAYFKKQFLNDAGFNTMTAMERNNYVSEYAVDDYFMFPNTRIVFVTMPYHLEACTLNNKANPTAFTIQFISKEAINQINWLSNSLDDIQRYENSMVSFGATSQEKLEANYYKGGIHDMNQTYGFGIRSGGTKLMSSFYWFAGVRMCLQPEQPKRACCSFTLDNVAVFGDAQAVTSAIQSSIDAQTAIVLNRIVNV